MVQVIKSRMVGACNMYGEEDRVLVGKREEKKPLGQPGVYGRIILKWTFGKWGNGLD